MKGAAISQNGASNGTSDRTFFTSDGPFFTSVCTFNGTSDHTFFMKPSRNSCQLIPSSTLFMGGSRSLALSTASIPAHSAASLSPACSGT